MPSHQTNEPPKDPAAARKEKNRIAVAASRERQRQGNLQLQRRHQNAQTENEILKQKIPKLQQLIKFMENALAKKQQNALAQQQPQSSASVSYHQPPADPQPYAYPQAAPLQQFPSAQQQYFVHTFQPQQQQQQSFPVAHQEFYPYQ